MKVSVIIPVFNEENDILECLNSLSDQSERDFEVIVVDDGSTDETLKVLSEFEVKNLKLKILCGKHSGAGSARNLGVKNARGRILVFVDADMTFDKDFISKLIDPIERGVATGTFSKEEFVSNENNVWAVLWNLNRGLPKNRMHSRNYPDRQNVFRAILKNKFDEAGGFNTKAGYIDDWSVSEKLGTEALSAPGAIFYHKNPGSLAEVFEQSRWMSKRKYKFGVLGIAIALIRVSLPVSVLVGLVSAFRLSASEFFIFKIVSDFAQFIGIFEYLFGKVAK